MAFIRNGDTIEFTVVVDDHISTDPPVGKYKVRNLWVDPATGKLDVDYDDTPVE